MEITLYNNQSEKNVLTKVLNNARTLDGSLREPSNISTPVILVNLDSMPYNYVYIPQFGRYYYIVDVESRRTGLWSLQLRCDVLMSFRTDILNSYAVVDHTEIANTTQYLNSDIWKTLVKDKTDIINFPSGLLETGEYILITAGGNQ